MSLEALDYTSSLKADRVLAPYDIQGSMAHLKMLAKCKIIKSSDEKRLLKALKEIEKEIKEGRFKFKEELEDVHLNIEARLIEKVGETGKKIHTARSRNDQIALDLRLYLRHEAREILNLLKELEREIVLKAERHLDVIMPGFTHLQPAQPILYSHYLMTYFHIFERDRERFFNTLDSIDSLPLGAAALAGTSFPIDRRLVARLLGFKKIVSHSIDAVSDRDFALDFIYAASMVMMHLSRLMEEMILWSTPAFGYIEISDEFCTTSSIMPQKKNPDVAELVRARSSRVFGNLSAFLTLMKALPQAYNRDLQEGNILIIETVSILKKSLAISAAMLGGIKVNKDKMEEALKEGFLEATEVADYLTAKGFPFRKSHEMVARMVKDLAKKGKRFSSISLAELKKHSPLFTKKAQFILDPETIVKSKKSEGGTSPVEVKKDIKRAKTLLYA